jgi:hypothetical protein
MRAGTIIAANVAVADCQSCDTVELFRLGRKAVPIRMFGRMTSVATPGSLALSFVWGTGAYANGTVLGTTAAFAPTASQTNMSWEAVAIIRCRATGAAGSLFCTGYFEANPAVVASTLQPILIPASVPAPLATCRPTSSVRSAGVTPQHDAGSRLSFEQLN